jgi:hypothetical protein
VSRIQRLREKTRDRKTLHELAVKEHKHLARVKAERVWYMKRVTEAQVSAKVCLLICCVRPCGCCVPVCVPVLASI